MAASGADALIVTARAEFLDRTWLGRPLRREMLEEFAKLDVDRAASAASIHTVVTGSPLFSSPLRLQANEIVQRSGCWAMDLTVDDAESQ